MGLALPSRRDCGLPPVLDDGGYGGKLGLTGKPDMHGEGPEVEMSL